MMKRLLTLAAAALLFAACAHHANHTNPYEGNLFYSKYLSPSTSQLDARIQSTIDALRANPRSATLHNDLGQLLIEKGFPKDAETEFERAINADRRFYPAWYNLGLVRMSRGDTIGARVAFSQTVRYKPGHSAALFQVGLMEEQRGHADAAIDAYAKAFTINHSLLDVRVNPRILDSKLVDAALLKAYPKDHARASMAFQPAPPGYTQVNLQPEAPSKQATPSQIVTPSAPVTDPSKQTPPPNRPPI
jgi:tetratricopeptide (TPR) repeat protein